MLNPKELRSGNIVMYRNHKQADVYLEFTITEVLESTVNVLSGIIKEPFKGWHIEELEPILITKERLIEFGFSYNEKANSCSKEFPTDVDIITNSISWIDGGISFGYYGQTLPHIKYIHQLQNLYFDLTGQELISVKFEKG